ncbi:restriction endonuclease [Streptomyces sp. NPDC006134]|uniref:restriction endonuclease n=1 Tax=Streptomyces sp. NPDC006134 TaxID=3154467 RepID=UPI0034016E9B
MASPARRIRTDQRRHPFDLRRTAVFFGLLAALVILAGFAARTVADLVERRPAWASVLVLAGGAGALSLWRRRRRLSVSRAARRAGAALDEAARTTVAAWDGIPSHPGGEPGAPGETADRWTTRPAEPAGRAGALGRAEPAVAQDTAADGAIAGTGRVAPDPAEDEILGPDEYDALGPDEYDALGPDEYDALGPDEYDALGPDEYDALGPDEFEHAVAALCVRDGCREAEVVGGAGDLGADVLAVAPDGRRVVIQCKRYGDGTTVGSQDVQRFGGTCFAVHRADVAVVVTTSGFTAPALDYAGQCGIVCLDGRDLRAWRDGTGPRPWEVRGTDDRAR